MSLNQCPTAQFIYIIICLGILLWSSWYYWQNSRLASEKKMSNYRALSGAHCIDNWFGRLAKVKWCDWVRFWGGAILCSMITYITLVKIGLLLLDTYLSLMLTMAFFGQANNWALASLLFETNVSNFYTIETNWKWIIIYIMSLLNLQLTMLLRQRLKRQQQGKDRWWLLLVLW